MTTRRSRVYTLTNYTRLSRKDTNTQVHKHKNTHAIADNVTHTSRLFFLQTDTQLPSYTDIRLRGAPHTHPQVDPPVQAHWKVSISEVCVSHSLSLSLLARYVSFYLYLSLSLALARALS